MTALSSSPVLSLPVPLPLTSATHPTSSVLFQIGVLGRVLMALRAMRLSLVPTPALRCHVPVIVRLRSKKQVRQFAARWIVTMVEHVHAFGDRSISNFPRYAVGQQWLAVVSATIDPAVTSRIGPPSPDEARLPSFKTGHKTLGQRSPLKNYFQRVAMPVPARVMLFTQPVPKDFFIAMQAGLRAKDTSR
jgi:hypothetical protein